MRISFNNTTRLNFSSSAPIYHVYLRNKNGSLSELSNAELVGPTLGLVRRLNKNNTREAIFLKKYIKDFYEYPLATSSIVGRNDLKKKHIIFGEDAYIANELRENCFKKENMTQPEISDIIHRSLIDPLDKKARLPRYKEDKIGEQIGLVLYADKINGKYNKLNGIKITSIDGRIFAELPAIEEKKTLKKNSKINPLAKEENTSTIVQKEEEKVFQPDLLGFEIPQQPRKNHWEWEQEIIFSPKKKSKQNKI